MKQSSQTQVYSLVADIGGTNTRLALADGSIVLGDTIRLYRNADYQDLAALFTHYLSGTGTIECHMACAAVAGLVRDGVANLTNLDWRIDNESIAQATGARSVALLNDLQAQGYSLDQITAAQLHEIIPKSTVANGATQLVIGIGTGFNATVVYHFESGCFAAPAEVGHANMPIDNEADLNLAGFIAKKHEFVAVEDVLSGRGIERIYAWLGHLEEVPLSASSDEVIQALACADPYAEETLRIFARLLGMTAGNLALSTLPFGGIYLVGGVSRGIAPYLVDYGFTDSFRGKGRFSDFMDNFSVSVIKDDYAALTGCARYLAECL